MKKRFIAICLVLILLIGGTAFADARHEAYEEIQRIYRTAFPEDGFRYENALPILEELVKEYEEENKVLDLDTYENAEVYYRYAKGVLAFDEGEYPTVIEKMTKLTFPEDEKVQKGLEPASYLAFAQGMNYLKNGDCDRAYAQLDAISGGLLATKYYYKRYTDAVDACTQGIKEKHLKSAESKLNSGEYQAAREECDTVEAVLPGDDDVREMRKRIDQADKETGPQEHSIEITSAKGKGPDSIALEWEGDQESYNVSWTADLAQGKNTKTEKVNGHALTITGLYPGTKYQITVDSEGYKAQTNAKTKDADQYQVEKDGKMTDLWKGTTVIYDYPTRDEFLEYLKTDKTAFDYLESKKDDKKGRRNAQEDENIRITQAKLEDHVLIISFVTEHLPEDFAGKGYVLLLHVDGVDTIVYSGQIGDEYVQCNIGSISRLYILVHDWLDLLAEKNEDGELTGKGYTLDLLVDGLLVCRATGTLE